MTDREQEKPLKKVEHISKQNKSQLMEGVNFNAQKIKYVNKEEIVNNVRVKMSEQGKVVDWDGDINNQVVNNASQMSQEDEEKKLDDQMIKSEADIEEGLNENNNQNERENEQPSQQQQCRNQENQSQQNNSPESQVPHQTFRPQQQHLQQVFIQQVFSPSHNIQQIHLITNQPISQQQEQNPIKQKNLSPRNSSLVAQQYNNIKYTYKEMQDEEIALSSASIIVSQHLVGSSGDVRKDQERMSMIRDKKQDMKVGSLEEIRSSESLYGNKVGEQRQERQQQKQKEEDTQAINPINDHQLVREKQKEDQVWTNLQKAQPLQQTQHNESTRHIQPSNNNTPHHQSSQTPPQPQSNKNPNQLTQSQHSQPPQQQQPQQSSQPQQPINHFSLERYKSIEPILQQLLSQLKNLLKTIKSDTHNYSKNKRDSSKFFNGKNSRSQSKNKTYKNSTGLLDIIERRKHQQQKNYFIAESGNSKHHDDTKMIHNLTHQHIGYKGQKDHLRVGVQGNKPKPIPYGLGNLGNPTQTDLLRNAPYRQTQSPDPHLSGDMSRVQQQQRQRLIINRNKINEILASSVSNFRKPESQKHKFKSTSYITRKPQPFSNNDTQKLHNNNDDISFMAEAQTPHHNQQLPNSRKIIRSTNFSKLNNRQPQSNQQIPSTSSKNTIEHLRQKAFFLQRQMDHNLPTSITTILKVVKKYLQVIAQGRIDDIETFLSSTGETYTNINELINRKKLFKTALYFQRASIVAGICYGYLMITQERGYLSYQMEHVLNPKLNPKQEGSSKLPAQTLKQHTKQVLKYMINLASFSLNNCKLISKTIEDHLMSKPTDSITDSENKTKSKPSQHQLIQKQIYKRNIETVKLNIQYTQETLQKLFGQTWAMMQKLALDEDFGQSFKNVSRLVLKHSIQESFYTLLEYFSFYLSLVKRQRSIPFLAVAPNPYLDTPQKYTLVIDFISVFCYGTKKSKTFVFRPYSQHFLWQMSQYFDIVVISDALPQQIDKIIDLLDTKNVIKHRLYKYHMVEQKTTGRYVKSLQRIGRDMDKVVLLDVEANRVTQQAKNTIFISEWKGSKNDSVLAELCSVLLSIVVNRLDCSKATAKIQAQMKVNIANGIRHINFGLDLKQSRMEDDKRKITVVNQGSVELTNQ